MRFYRWSGFWFCTLLSLFSFLIAFGCSPAKSSSTDGGASSDDTNWQRDTAGTDADADTNMSWDTDFPSIWGWISAIEWNDTCDQWYLKTDWLGGVRAYFAERASFPRSLPHTLDFIPMVASEGDCKLYDAGIIANCELSGWSGSPDAAQIDCFMCVDINFECTENIRWCDQDQQCHSDPNTMDGVCRDLPLHWNLGTITLSGTKEPITMAPDEYDRYAPESLSNPNDLFDDGDIITAQTEGGVLPSLSFSTKGVAPLEVPNTVIQIVENQSTVVEWTPSDADSRIQIAIMSGSHDPNPLTAAILCDVPDSQGQVEISANLINGFLKETCLEAMMKCSRITRYNRDVRTLNGKQLELFVGSARNLQLNLNNGWDW